MSWADRLWEKVDRAKEGAALRRAARENAQWGNTFDNGEKFIPPQYTGGHPKSYTREIKSTLTGETIYFEDKYGEWTEASDAREREWEAMKNLGHHQLS